MAPDADRPRSDAGRYDDRIDPDTVLDVFDARADQARPLTAGDVVEEMGIARRTAHNKLNALVERGVLETRKVGARGRVWWIPDRQASDGETARETAETPSTVSGDRTDTASDDRDRQPPETPTEDGQDADADGDIVDAVAKGWDDTGDRLDARKEAARAVLAYAREHGAVSKQEAKEEVRPEHPVEGQNARTWYRKNVRPVLNEVAEYDKSARAYRLVEDADA
jgi:hypothetical protein